MSDASKVAGKCIRTSKSNHTKYESPEGSKSGSRCSLHDSDSGALMYVDSERCERGIESGVLVRAAEKREEVEMSEGFAA